MYKLTAHFAGWIAVMLAMVSLAACNLSGAPEVTTTPTATDTPVGDATQAAQSGAPTTIPATIQVAPTGQRPPTVVVAQLPTNTLIPTSILILSPAPGNIVAGNVQVLGSAAHPQFLQYQLEYGPDPNPANLWYPASGIVQTQAVNGLLGVWNSTLTQDGTYQLRLRVYLRDGSSLTAAAANVRVQNQSPTSIPTTIVPPSPPPRPIAFFAASPTAGSSPLQVQFVDQSTGVINNYNWDFGDGGTSAERNPTHRFSVPGAYRVTLSISGPGGQSRSQMDILVTTPSATPSATPTASRTPAPLVTITASPTATATITPTPSASATTTPSQTMTSSATPTGTLTLTLTATASATPSATPTETATVMPSETPTLTLTFTETASATTTETPTETATVTPSATPTETPTLTLTFTETASATPTETPTETATVTPSEIPTETPTLTLTFTETASATPTETPTLTPTFTETATATPSETPTEIPTETATTTPSETPTETPTLTPTFTETASATPTETPTETATVTPSETPTETPTLTPTFTETASATPTETPTETATVTPSETPTETPTLTPTFTETATATPSETPTEIPTETPTATIPPPGATVTADFSSGPAPLTVQFASQTSGEIQSYFWDFGDGGTSFDANPVYTFNFPGVYTVTLAVTGPGGVASAQTTITVDIPAPTASVTQDTSEGSAPLTVSFFSQSSGSVEVYAWDFGDGGVSSDANPIYTFTAPGIYTVTLTVSGAGGSSQAQAVITVSEPATAPPSVMDTIPVLPDLNMPTLFNNLRIINQNGLNLGSRASVFALAGDDPLLQPALLDPFSGAAANLDDGSNFLQDIINWYNGSDLGGTTSFNRQSLAMRSGWTAEDVLNPANSDPSLCAPGETPLACEIRLVQPAVLLINVGTSDALRQTDTGVFRTNLLTITQVSAASGVIPVLITLPPRLDGALSPEQAAAVNEVIVEVATAANVPVVNLWRALNELPGSGLNGDGVTLSVAPGGAGDLTGSAVNTNGANRANLVLLNLLHTLRSVIFPDAAP